MLSLLSTIRAQLMKASRRARRTPKTPGELYRLLREEFEQRRPAACRCAMPLIRQVEEATPGEANWRLETFWSQCDQCRSVIAQVAARNAALYDMRPLAGPGGAGGALAYEDRINPFG